ncbi:MAG: hypothetical protein K0R62_5760, partial [Nonomuraea muscovyensis]|nr:hypothetical protein [Nonomuraea muscovyensis]
MPFRLVYWKHGIASDPGANGQH